MQRISVVMGIILSAREDSSYTKQLCKRKLITIQCRIETLEKSNPKFTVLNIKTLTDHIQFSKMALYIL